MAIGGTSAGGNITLSSGHRFKDLGLPVPGALYLGTPCVDLTMTGDSRFLNEGVDRILPAWKNIPYDHFRYYAVPRNQRKLNAFKYQGIVCGFRCCGDGANDTE
jgi:acetyl esterase/lipase